jgi:hypothetical protein
MPARDAAYRDASIFEAAALSLLMWAAGLAVSLAMGCF